MSISGVRSSSGVNQTQMGRMNQTAKTRSDKLVQDLDANKDGGLDKKEFVSGMVSKGMSAAVASKAFDTIDAKKTGKINGADIESALNSGKIPRPPPPGGPGGPPPPGGPGPAKGDSKAGESKTSDTKNYETADTNKDGKVDAVESLVYEQKHPQAAAKSQDMALTTSASTSLGTHVDTVV
ncbi:EF-hand domain-containing protein [Limnohabitans sp. Rim8]|jgi:hypothetical protein|uniref:EF-hand domain-containing protein n=1 Tax=Limnohabitans sp. Rim8 TaxID=1100718 RepID=UPI0033057BDC